MKILQVVQFFSSNHGGSAIVPYEVSKQLQKKGHDVTVITTDFMMNNEFIDSLDGVEVIPFHCQMNIGGLLISSSINKYLKENIYKFDIIHMHNFRTYQNIIVHKYAKKYGIPYVLQAHGSVLRIIEKKGFKYLFDKFFGYRILKDAAKAIAVSNMEIEQYIQMRVSKEKIIVIPNSIDIDLFKNLPEKGTFRKQFGISEKHIILFLGRLHQIKGIEFLIRSSAELKKEVDDIVLVLAGPDGGYKVKAKILINELNLAKHVRFTGYIDKVDKLSAYVDADILVYPSVFEIFGLVPFEAILCGTPIIVTNDCGCGEVVREANCGYLVKYGDINDLKSKMKSIIENPEEGKEMIDRGIKYINENLACDKVVEKMEIMYEDCL